jgi:hypothetical protein
MAKYLLLKHYRDRPTPVNDAPSLRFEGLASRLNCAHV